MSRLVDYPKGLRYLHDISPRQIFKYARLLYFNEKFLRIARLAEIGMNIDSKNIVDRPIKQPLNDVLHALSNLNEANLSEIKAFMRAYFSESGFDILAYSSPDWSPQPEFLQTITKPELIEFAHALNSIWIYLYRKFDYETYDLPLVSSHIAMKHPFIVPGGRFREMYYWDNYWIARGLLVCGMYKSVKMLIENFIDFIRQFGFIPNGSRIYYLNRSQPPYFSKIVWDFYEYLQNDVDIRESEKSRLINDFILGDVLECMVKEHEFWMRYRSVNVQNYTLNIYGANSRKPRIESYFEDLKLAKGINDKSERDLLFLNITAATESGYDFSSRWLSDPFDMQTIQTTQIIPIDLNSILFETELIISKLYKRKGNLEKSNEFFECGQKRQAAINALLWSPRLLYWCDYSLKDNRLNDSVFYITNFSPLYSNIHPPRPVTETDIINKYKNNVLLRCENGVPVSFTSSGQQWDYPNIWAPNQHDLVKLLLKFDYELALAVAKRFFHTVYKGWKDHGVVYEKYLATQQGERGIGGEYKVQYGFGWTNGTIFDFISIFKDELFK